MFFLTGNFVFSPQFLSFPPLSIRHSYLHFSHILSFIRLNHPSIHPPIHPRSHYPAVKLLMSMLIAQGETIEQLKELLLDATGGEEVELVEDADDERGDA
jgi:hypothetical protein